MYTVLLTDDEKSVTDSLKNDIPWANLGVETILTASDGRQALKIIESSHVDLLITDIRMPRMDGLELLTRIRSVHPEIHCILLTAYGEFEYAMKAMKLGVDNYLMKPMQIQELTETVENTLDNIYIRRENREALFRENILRRWITGTISSDELGERTVFLDLNIYQSSYCVIAVKKRNASVSIGAFGQECIRRFPSGLECASVWDNAGHYLLIAGGRQITGDVLVPILYQTAEQFDILNLVDIAVGITVFDRSDVHISYERACDLIDNDPDPGRPPIRVCHEAPDGTALASEINEDALSPIVKRAIRYIKEHYAEGVSIKEFCSSLNINAAYLGYLFKKETGTFFNNYLIDFRMDKAVELLCTTGEKIADIAEMTGYTTTSHFIATFKKKTGLSPLKYREIHGGMLS